MWWWSYGLLVVVRSRSGNERRAPGDGRRRRDRVQQLQLAVIGKARLAADRMTDAVKQPAEPATGPASRRMGP